MYVIVWFWKGSLSSQHAILGSWDMRASESLHGLGMGSWVVCGWFVDSVMGRCGPSRSSYYHQMVVEGPEGDPILGFLSGSQTGQDVIQGRGGALVLLYEPVIGRWVVYGLSKGSGMGRGRWGGSMSALYSPNGIQLSSGLYIVGWQMFF
jgi:hypothetical protein